MGRTKRWSETTIARFAEGTFEAIDAVSASGEDRTDFMREAVNREILRRWLAMRQELPRTSKTDPEIARYHDPARTSELTSSQAKEVAGTVTLTRTMLHALDGVMIRCAAILPDTGSDADTLPRRSDGTRRKQS